MDVSLVMPFSHGNGNIGCSQNMYNIERISQYTSARQYGFQAASYCELRCSKMVVLWEQTGRNRKRRGKDEKEIQGVRTTVERITDCLAHFGTMQVEIICLFWQLWCFGDL